MEPTCAELCVVTTPLEFYEFNRPHTRQTLVERVPCRYGTLNYPQTFYNDILSSNALARCLTKMNTRVLIRAAFRAANSAHSAPVMRKESSKLRRDGHNIRL